MLLRGILSRKALFDPAIHRAAWFLLLSIGRFTEFDTCNFHELVLHVGSFLLQDTQHLNKFEN